MNGDTTPESPLEKLLIGAGPRPAPTADQTDRVREAVREAWLQETGTRRRRRVAGYVTASLAAAAVLAAVVIPWRTSDIVVIPPIRVATLDSATGTVSLTRPEGTPAAIAPPYDVVLGSRLATSQSRARLRLLGGAEVRLDVNTEVTIEGERIELIGGAVYIDTGGASSAARAVTVSTRFGDAHDIGTRFEVRVLDEAVRVRVRDGEVRLERGLTATSAPAGFELLAPRGAAVSRRAFAATDSAWNWITSAAPPFAIEGQTLAAFIAWIETEGGWQVRFATSALARRFEPIVLHGSIEGLAPLDALDVVLPASGLRHRIDGDTVVIESSNESGGR
jgi:ferric-dicitrate binding protein FerR (iron transport regulator)